MSCVYGNNNNDDKKSAVTHAWSAGAGFDPECGSHKGANVSGPSTHVPAHGSLDATLMG